MNVCAILMHSAENAIILWRKAIKKSEIEQLTQRERERVRKGKVEFGMLEYMEQRI